MSLPMRAKSFLSTVTLVTLLVASMPCGIVRAQSAPADRSGDDERTIRGTVLNRITHEPIARALVYSPDNRYATMTDDQGHFEFRVSIAASNAEIPGRVRVVNGLIQVNGPYALLARKPGFLMDRDQVLVAPAASLSDTMIYLQPEGRIIGKVTTPDASSVLRFYVELYRRVIRDGEEHWENAGGFTTWADGEFRFFDLVPGTYKLVTREQMDRDLSAIRPNEEQFGYPPSFYPEARDFTATGAIRVAAGETVQANLSPTRQQYYRVKIPILNSSEAPMNVLVYPLGHPGPGFSLGYDPTEQAITGMLPDGGYTVSAVSRGAQESSGATNFSVRGAAVEGPALNLVPDTALVVHVKEILNAQNGSTTINKDGSSTTQNWSGNLQVMLDPMDEFSAAGGAGVGLSRPAAGGAPGVLEIPNVAPGRYRVQVTPIVGYASAVLYGENDLIRQPLVVARGGAGQPIEITVRDDGAEVDGTIEDGSPADSASAENGFVGQGQGQRNRPQCFVYFLPTGGSSGQYREMTSDPNGTFIERQLPPGEYLVLAFAGVQSELSLDSQEMVSRLESQGKVIQVDASQKIQVRVKVIPEEERQ
jgi:hypothetical protein